MIRYFTLVLLFSFNFGYSQDKVLIDDDFLDNRNKWDVGTKSPEFNVAIKNGALFIEKKNKNSVNNGCLWYVKPIAGLDTKKDFSIVLNAKFISGGDFSEYLDIQWGALSKSDINKKSMLYQLDVFFDGSVRLSYFQTKWDYFNRVNIKDKLDNMAFNPRENNKYEINQIDGFICLKINDIEVFKQYILPIDGNSIGFQQCTKKAWELDNIKITQHSNNYAVKSLSLDSVMSKQVINDKLTVVKKLGDKKDQSLVADSVINYQIKNDGLKVFKEDELIIYPNPFTDKFNIKFNVYNKEEVEIFLISVSGEIIKREKRVFEAGEVNYDMTALVPEGVYIVRVITASNKALFKKIIRVPG